jgi:hypothetical protein
MAKPTRGFASVSEGLCTSSGDAAAGEPLRASPGFGDAGETVVMPHESANHPAPGKDDEALGIGPDGVSEVAAPRAMTQNPTGRCGQASEVSLLSGAELRATRWHAQSHS